jgi:integrase
VSTVDATEVPIVEWPHPSQASAPQNLIDVHRFYLRERLARRGSNVSRPRASFRNINEFFGPAADPTDLKLVDWQRYEDHRYAQGVKPPTVRREITFHQAAMRHALKRERIAKVPHIEKPSGDVIHERRAATQEEYRLLMGDGKMPYRIRMFFRLAYFTGHRAQAIEQLEWSRVDWQEGTLDFNLPGRIVKTKKRNGAFPIPDELLPFLQSAYKRHLDRFPSDPYVIGAGKRGGASSTGAECKAAWKSVGIDVDGLNRHCFRKTFITEKVKAGVPLPTAATLIGDRADTAGKHYFKVAPKDMRDAVNRKGT